MAKTGLLRNYAGLIGIALAMVGCGMTNHVASEEQAQQSGPIQQEFNCLKGTEVVLAINNPNPTPTATPSPSPSPSPSPVGGIIYPSPTQQGTSNPAVIQTAANSVLLATVATPSRDWVNQAFFLFNAQKAFVVQPPETASRTQIAAVALNGFADPILIQVIRTSQPPTIAFGDIFVTNSVPANFSTSGTAISEDQARPGIVSTISVKLSLLRDRVTASPNFYRGIGSLPATLDACDQVKTVNYSSDGGTVFINVPAISSSIRKQLQ